MLERSIYIEAEESATAVLLGGLGYTGAGLEREEIIKKSSEADNYQGWCVRRSANNGRTWSESEDLPDINVQLPKGGIVTYPGAPQYDPATNRTYRVSMKRIWPGHPLYTFSWKDHKHPFHDHVFVSENDGQPQCLRYEEGADFDLNNPFDPDFGYANRAYRGQSICFDGHGGAFLPMVCYRQGENFSFNEGGLVLMRRSNDGQWHASNTIYIDPALSSRGLLEPDVTLLNDGRILIVCRGCDTPTTPGRKWMTYSEDGGRTLAPIREFGYSNGERFYSPSSIHRFFRSKRRGTLFWIGNICPEPPSRNLPRYPLCMGVIDEKEMALSHHSIDRIDDRGPDDPEALSLSNFLLLEDKKTLNIEMYMTRDAPRDTPNWKSSVYRYLFSP